MALFLASAASLPTHRSVALNRHHNPLTFTTDLIISLSSGITSAKSCITSSETAENLDTNSKALLTILSFLNLSIIYSPELAFELACEGLHGVLSKLLQWIVKEEMKFEGEEEEEEDIRTLQPTDPMYTYSGSIKNALNDISDYTYTLISSSQSHSIPFPSPKSLLTEEEKLNRRPRIYKINKHHNIIISQVENVRQSSQEDVGYVMWPSALILFSYITHNHTQLFTPNSHVIELGAGCGMTGMGLSKVRGDLKVKVTDYNEVVLGNLGRNLRINLLEEGCETMHQDFYDHDGTSTSGWISKGKKIPTSDYIVAADVVCKDEDATAAAKTIKDCLKIGGKGYVVSGTGEFRFGVAIFKEECLKVGLKCSTRIVTAQEILGEGEEILEGLKECSGYVEEMTFFFHEIEKV